MTHTQSIKFRSFAFYNGNLKRTMVSGRSETPSSREANFRPRTVSAWKYTDHARAFPFKNQQ